MTDTAQQPKKKYTKLVPRKQRLAFTRKLFIIAMLAYPIIHFLVFWLYINFNTIVLSFQRFSFSDGLDRFNGINNYIQFFKVFGAEDTASQIVVRAIGNSFAFFIFNNFILLPISIFFAYLLFKKVFAEKVFRIIFFLPNIISIVVLSMCFKFLLDPNFGPIHTLLENLGFNMPINGVFMTEGEGPISVAQIMIFAYCLWAGVGYNVLLLSGSIARIPTEILEAGKIDGIGMAREFVQIVRLNFTKLVWI